MGAEGEMPQGYTNPKNIGHGGWADVYQCTDGKGRRVAVKLFRDRLTDPHSDQDFRREFAAASALSAHPGVITLYEGGITVGRRPWLAMELASNGSVADVLAQSGPLTPEVATSRAVLIADTLAWAHTRPEPVIHGDVKSANVLVDDAGQPRITDFGAAGFARDSRSVTVHQLAQTHAAPEVLVHNRATPAADVWSLAATLFEMLVGRAPFVPAETEGVVSFAHRVLAGLPADAIPGSVPEPIADVIRSGLTVDLNERIANMSLFAQALRTAQETLELPATPPWRTQPDPLADQRFVSYHEATTIAASGPLATPRRRRKIIVVAAAAVILLAGAGFAFASSGGGQPQGQRPKRTVSPRSVTSQAVQPSGTPSVVAQPTGAAPVTTNAAPPAQPPAQPPIQPPVQPSRPDVVTAFTIFDSSGGAGLDGRLAYSISPPSSTAAIQRYEVEYTGDDSADITTDSTGGDITGLANGTTYSVRIRACADLCAAWSSPRTGRPYGPVQTPGVAASKWGDRQISLSWSAPWANGRALSQLHIRVNGGGWENVGVGNGSRIVGNGPNQNHAIEVRAVDEAGQISGSASANAMTSGSWINVAPGANAQGLPGCSAAACRYIVVELRNFAAGTTYTCTFNSSLGSGGWSARSFNTDGNGNAGPTQTPFYYGVASGWVTVTCGGVTGTRNPWL